MGLGSGGAGAKDISLEAAPDADYGIFGNGLLRAIARGGMVFGALPGDVAVVLFGDDFFFHKLRHLRGPGERVSAQVFRRNMHKI